MGHAFRHRSGRLSLGYEINSKHSLIYFTLDSRATTNFTIYFYSAGSERTAFLSRSSAFLLFSRGISSRPKSLLPQSVRLV
jgi:hypothetical protein